MAEEAEATAKVGTFEEWLQFREDLATGDRDIDKLDRRMFRALREMFLPAPAPNSPVDDHIKDNELLLALRPLESLAVDARFRAAATEIGLSRSIEQLRVIFGSTAVKHGAARKGAAPREPMATLNIWILVETTKRAENRDTSSACEFLESLGGISVKKDTVSAPSTRKLSNASSIRRRYSEEAKRLSENIFFRLFAERLVLQSLQQWRESGKTYKTWERKRLADMARGALVVSGNYPILSPT